MWFFKSKTPTSPSLVTSGTTGVVGFNYGQTGVVNSSTIRGIPLFDSVGNKIPAPKEWFSGEEATINPSSTAPKEAQSMSVLSTIKTDVEKFFKNTGADLEKFGTAFEKLFKKSPSALQTVENFVGEVAPVVEAVVAIADPVAEAPLVAALATVETGLAAIEASAVAANSGTSLLTNLENFVATVPSLLTGIDVKDAALTAKITTIVNLVTNECKVLIPAVESWIAQIKSSTTTI